MRSSEIRNEKKLTPTQLAKKSGLSVTFIKMLETDKRSPTLRTLSKIAAALDVTIVELLDK